MKKLLTLVLISFSVVCINGQWTEIGTSITTPDAVITSSSTGYVSTSNALSSGWVTDTEGRMSLYRTTPSDVSLRIDDEFGDFNFHPKLNSSTITLWFQRNQDLGIFNSMGRMEITSNQMLLNSSRVTLEGSEVLLRGPNCFLFVQEDSMSILTERIAILGRTSDDSVLMGIGGPNSGNYNVEVYGDIGVSGGIYGLSDGRLKRDIHPLTNSLVRLRNIIPRTYFFIDQNNKSLPLQKQIGLIAQEVELEFPEVVKTGEDSEQLKSINYQGLVPVLIGAINEQQLLIEKQQEQIDFLIKEMESRRVDK